METLSLIITLHTASTLYMVGLIWVVQQVHYPLFVFAAGDRYPAFQRAHMTRITRVVMPPMLVELGSTVALLVVAPPAAGVHAVWAVWLGAALLAGVWLSTWLLQVPAHNRLLSRFDERSHRRLVRTNWVRTALWTARGGLALYVHNALLIP